MLTELRISSVRQKFASKLRVTCATSSACLLRRLRSFPSPTAHILQLHRTRHDDVVGGFAPFDLDVAAVVVDEGFAGGEVAAGGGDDGGAVVAAASEGLAGVAFPGAEARFGLGEDLQEADIDALR